jgi:hypothetical protein
MNCFRYLLVSSLLLTGQLPTLSTLVFRISLSLFSILHWNIRWSTVCVPCFYLVYIFFLFYFLYIFIYFVYFILFILFCLVLFILFCLRNLKVALV